METNCNEAEGVRLLETMRRICDKTGCKDVEHATEVYDIAAPSTSEVTSKQAIPDEPYTPLVEFSTVSLPQETPAESTSVAFCGKCGTKITSAAVFCPSCGATVTGNTSETSQTEKLSTTTEAKQFKFDEPKYLLGIPIRGTNYKTVCTTIEIKKGIINVRQWNDGVFVNNTPNEFSISPQDISFIQMETLWDWAYIILVILQIVIALNSEKLFYKVILAVWNALFGIKRKEVRLRYRNGDLLIPDSGSETGNVRELATLLQNLNPAIRVTGFEEK